MSDYRMSQKNARVIAPLIRGLEALSARFNS